MNIEEIDINEIKPYKNNPREIPIEAVEKVMKSIKEFGNNQPIVLDQDNVIVVGHTRWKALKNLGKNKAFVLKRNFSKQEATAYRIMDNRSGDESKWEKDLLKQELLALQDANFDIDLTGLGFDEIQNFTEEKLEFKPTNDLKTDINLDDIQAPTSTVKMVQLFLDTETEQKFKQMIKELQVEYNKDNLTDTVFAVVEREYKNYKDELIGAK